MKLEEETRSRKILTKVEEINVTVPQTDYVLGLADLTGELMRNAILNSLGSSITWTSALFYLKFQILHAGFRPVQNSAPPSVSKKVYTTLKQSMRKVGGTPFYANVRGSEIPKSHLADHSTSQLIRTLAED